MKQNDSKQTAVHQAGSQAKAMSNPLQLLQDRQPGKALQLMEFPRTSGIPFNPLQPQKAVVQKLKVDDEDNIDIDALIAERAEEILTGYCNRAANITATPEEIVKVAYKTITTDERYTLWETAQTTFNQNAEAIIAIARGKNKKSAKEVVTLTKSNVNSMAPLAAQALVAARDKKSIKDGICKRYNIQRDFYTKGTNALKKVGIQMGLPDLGSETIEGFKVLETHRDAAREVREPIDTILQKYVKQIEELIPGAKIAYRGSLARGVKSPGKYVNAEEGPSIAAFNDEAIKADTREVTNEGNSTFDIDANIVIPDSLIADATFKEGPLAKSTSALAVRLKTIQANIALELTAAKIPGYDTADKFEFFVASGGTVEHQLATGNPYTVDMVTNAGMGGYAASAPKFFSKELENKIEEYSTTVGKSFNGYIFLPPVTWWDPYFSSLYSYIKTNGPLAVAMPEVRVNISRSGASEETQLPAPRSNAKNRAPVNLLPEGSTYSWASGMAPTHTGHAHTGQVTGKKGNTVFINIGGVSCVAFNNLSGYIVETGHSVMCHIDKIGSGIKGDSTVVTILRVKLV